MLIAIIVALAVVASAIAYLTQVVRAHQHIMPEISANLQWVPYSTMMQRAGSSAQGVRIPASDAFGSANADGHAVELYYLPTAGALNGSGTFYEVCAKDSGTECAPAQAVNSVAVYQYTYGAAATKVGSDDTLVGPCNAHQLDTPADYTSANNPVAGLFAGVTFPSPKVYHWGYPGLISKSNDTFAVACTTKDGLRTIVIGNPNVTVAAAISIGTATPTPHPLTLSVNPVKLRAPVANAASTTIGELNYGTRVTVPAQVYKLSPPAAPETACAGIATHAPGTPLTPGTGGAGDAVLTFTPVIALANSNVNCDLMVTDNVGQVVDIKVDVGKVYPPKATANFAFSFTGPSTQSVGVTEENYALPAADGDRGGFMPGAGLASSVTAAPATVCSAPTLDSAVISGAGNDFTETEAWFVGFKKAGVCTVTFTDVYGQVGTTKITAQAPIGSWPPGILYPVGADTITASGCAAGQPRAYTATGFTAADIDANDHDPYGAGFTTNANGCEFQGGTAVTSGNPSMAVNEAGYANRFSQANSCGASLGANGFTPSAFGPTTTVGFVGDNVTATPCIVTFTDTGSGSTDVSVKVAAIQWQLIDGINTGTFQSLQAIVAFYTAQFTANPPCKDPNTGLGCWTIYTLLYDGTNCPLKIDCSTVVPGEMMVYWQGSQIEYGPPCVSPEGCIHIVGLLLAHGPYEQRGETLDGTTIAGTYHYPLRAGDLSASFTRAWCGTVAGSVTAAHCDVNVSWAIPGVTYPPPPPTLKLLP
jgi:hypothetical protein